MKFLPLTRQVELEQSSPEKLISATPDTFFYRVGNDLFYLVKDGNYQRIEISKKGFTLKYNNQIWYATIEDKNIVFENPYELWQKKGSYGSTGWKFISYNPLSVVGIQDSIGPTPTPTPTPTPSPTPIGSNGLLRTIYSGYFADDPNWFDTATALFSNLNTGSLELGYDGEEFSVQWVGYFVPQTTEIYKFYIESDDATYMWIGNNALSGYTTGNTLISNPGIHDPVEATGSISLTAGTPYPVRIQYGENFGGNVFNLSISTNTISKTQNLSGKIFYLPF